MIEICSRLFVGSELDYEMVVKFQQGWRVIHACKEPYHRQLLGYKGRGAPKEHPEYLIAKRGNRLFLNLVDADDPEYIPKEIIDESLQFIKNALETDDKVLVHCNQGESRSPAIGLLYLALYTDVLPRTSLADAEAKFVKIHQAYNPKGGMKGFLRAHWDEYINMIRNNS